jgi:hypothetical protein
VNQRIYEPFIETVCFDCRFMARQQSNARAGVAFLASCRRRRSHPSYENNRDEIVLVKE